MAAMRKDAKACKSQEPGSGCRPSLASHQLSAISIQSRSRGFRIGTYGMLAGVSWVLLWFLSSRILSVPAYSQTGIPDQRASATAAVPPGVEIQVDAKPRQATVGDLIRIDFDFSLPQGYQLRFPQLPGEVGDFTILNTFPGPDVPEEQAERKERPPPNEVSKPWQSGSSHYRARVVAAAYKTGDFEFPALSIALQGPDGGVTEVSTPTVKISIVSVLAPDDNDLRDLKKQAEIAEPTRWLIWIGLGLGIIAAGLLFWWWSRRRRRRQVQSTPVLPGVDPLEQAEADLRALMAQGLLQKGLVKHYYVRISEIVKRALEAGYEIQTIEKTTSEIMTELRPIPTQGVVEPEAAALEQVETLLLSCDMVKFARYVPSIPESEEVAKDAFEILGDCRVKRAQAASGVVSVAGVE